MTKRDRKSQGLAPELKRLVRIVEATLGRVVVKAEGKKLYAAVEAIRLDMVSVREGHHPALRRARTRLRRLSPTERTAVARAYTVYLELVNVCENAYRTHRLRERARATDPSRTPRASANVVFVLTAHPTESRSPINIQLMRRIQTLLLRQLIETDLQYDPCPMITEGMMVEVVNGPLKGVVGRLVRKGPHARLVLSVELINQGVSVEVDAADVKPY